MIKRAVVVGGAGAVGRLFTERLLDSGARVTVVDTAEPEPGDGRAARLRGDVTAVDFRLAAELGHADLVVLAVPEPVALKAIHGVAAEMRPDALLVDTLSVKGSVARAVRAEAPGVQAVGLNPMFAPSLGFEGRPVAAVVINAGSRTEELLALVESWGARIVRVDEQRHDRLAAASQALVHAAVLSFGIALAGMDVPGEDLRAAAPPPANTLLALLARIASGTPEVYWDVQHGNPEAAPARKALADAVRRLADTVEHGTEADFADLLGELRTHLGDDLAHHRDTCAALFARI
ncbi:prephenate dehydrogenase/arogenate dehydrogenase family protein [Streptomyces sp. NPDC006610]|uniref:prephenate dehydrogenase/arogenate dehydrogenase family protein n=1 Tax=Streptomyces sp. NPDC006610 TaxID=3154584 RepID=UPI0033BEC94C